MMKKTLCVSMLAKTPVQCTSYIQSSNADMIEHRLDFMEVIPDLNEVYCNSEKPIIATCRSIHDGGFFSGTESQRICHLLNALSAGASYADIELNTSPSLTEIVRNKTEEVGSQLIVSKHFHEHTPTLVELTSTLESIAKLSPDIAKIVTTPLSVDDCKIVLQLYDMPHKTRPDLISFAMSNLGKFTRVFALFLGAPFMYVAQDDGLAAAHGQIPLSKMRTLLEILQ